MSEMKRPKRYALEGIDRGKFFYYADEADAYIAALERRLQAAVDALTYLMEFPDAPRAKELAGKVIDSEQR